MWLELLGSPFGPRDWNSHPCASIRRERMILWSSRYFSATAVLNFSTAGPTFVSFLQARISSLAKVLTVWSFGNLLIRLCAPRPMCAIPLNRKQTGRARSVRPLCVDFAWVPLILWVLQQNGRNRYYRQALFATGWCRFRSMLQRAKIVCNRI